jgi:phosphoribosyl-ATP pyrophosphohydrolase/phosphoribosyl-AMP cyclohydrolase
MTDLQFDEAGLVPGIVQDASTGRVLMLGYLNRESLDLTLATGEVHFWSRSRGELWRKGETSGNTLQVVDVRVDCDGDTMLISAHPAGPTCHEGTESCFAEPLTGSAGQIARAGTLDRLWEVIESRAAERPDGSYTTSLMNGGVDATGRKVTEEATEVLLAAKDHAAGTGPAERVSEEAADLVYHLMVTLAERGVAWDDVVDVLAGRAH